MVNYKVRINILIKRSIFYIMTLNVVEINIALNNYIVNVASIETKDNTTFITFLFKVRMEDCGCCNIQKAKID